MKNVILNFIHSVIFMQPSLDFDKGQDFDDYFNVSLKDEDGDGYQWFEGKDGFKCSPNEEGAKLQIAMFPLSMKQVNNFIAQAFTNRHIPLLMDNDIKKDLLKRYGKLEAVIMPKTKGDTFTASEFTKEVFDETKNSWVTAIAGKDYLIQRNGYRFDYETPLNVDFDIPLVERIQIKSLFADKLAQLEANEVEARKAHQIKVGNEAKKEASKKAEKEAEKETTKK